MAKKLQVYETPEITVTFDPGVCRHSGACLRSLPAVFDVRRAHWVRPENGDPNEVAAAVQRCPSGALKFYRNVSRNPAARTSLASAVLLNELALLVAASEARPATAAAVCRAIARAREYRWVGVYDVLPGEIAIAGWSGGEEPAHPRFPVGQGLSGAAVETREPVVANDVANDPRYLTTFGTTRAELVVPVLDPATREAVGTIDVETDRVNAFGEEDRRLLEDCARAIAPLWERE